MTTSTSAKLAALHAAMTYVTEEPAQKWVIFCDSKAALHSIKSALHHRTYEQMISDIREVHHHALETGHSIVFQWIPAHCGIIGNDIADRAARSAHEDTQTRTIPLARTDTARELRLLARKTSQALWSSSAFNCRLYKLDPLLRLQLPSSLSRGEATLLCRLWLGVAFTNAYSHRMGMAESPMCDSCMCEETIEHLLCTCPRYDVQRLSLRTTLNRLDSRPFSESKILGPWLHPSLAQKALRALVLYLKCTGLRDRL